jgi:cytochrome c oxidase subunit 2
MFTYRDIGATLEAVLLYASRTPLRSTRRTVAVLAFAILLGQIAPRAQTPQPAKTITIHVQKFAFTPDAITLKKDQPVKLVLISDDVRHSLSVRDIGIRAVALPGQPADVAFTPTTVGDFTGTCSVFCGSGHRDMQFVVHVVE